MGPSNGESSMAPIRMATLSRKSPASAIIVAKRAIVKTSLLNRVYLSVLSTSLSSGLGGVGFLATFSLNLSRYVDTAPSTHITPMVFSLRRRSITLEMSATVLSAKLSGSTIE